MKSTKIRKERGITLIALIITIVVLMILAAVAISSIQNDGIIGHAEEATNKFTEEQKKEESFLQDYEDMLTALNGGYKDKNFKVGDEVTVGGENFYVIEDKTSQGKVVLLAEKCIEPNKTNTNYLKQSDSASYIAFSKINYWKDDFASAPHDLNEEGEPDTDKYALYASYKYGEKIGGKGRLMRKSEADILKVDYTDIIYGTENAKLSYWLGYAENTISIRYVFGASNDSINGFYTSTSNAKVRPVVEISKSKVDKVSQD